VVLNGRLNKDNKLALSELGVRILAEVPTVESLDHAIDLVPDFNML
jgi:hypothetical protein